MAEAEAAAPVSPQKPQDNPISQQPTSDNPNQHPDQPDPSQIPNPNSTLPSPPVAPPTIQPYAPPSFRPAAPPVPLPLPPQFSPVPSSSFQPQNHGVQPPGVGPGPGSGSGGLVYQQQMMRPSYMQMPNGYLPMPPPVSS